MLVITERRCGVFLAACGVWGGAIADTEDGLVEGGGAKDGLGGVGEAKDGVGRGRCSEAGSIKGFAQERPP